MRLLTKTCMPTQQLPPNFNHLPSHGHTHRHVGLTENDFKTRYGNHTSCRHAHSRNFLKWDCHSAWVIYMIEYKICKLLYIGKSETKCNTRFSNHRSHIRTSKNNCKLSEHFLYNRRTRNFENDVTITLIEQKRKEHRETNMKMGSFLAI